MSRRVFAYLNKFNAARSEHLSFCEASMRNSLGCLSFLSTFHDLIVQVVNVQHYWLECDTWLVFMEKVQPHILSSPLKPLPRNTNFMSAFMSDPTVVLKLYNAGIPVRFVRTSSSITSEMAVIQICNFTAPDGIETETGIFTGDSVYTSLDGESHHAAVCLDGHTYTDIPKIILNTSTLSTGERFAI